MAQFSISVRNRFRRSRFIRRKLITMSKRRQTVLELAFRVVMSSVAGMASKPPDLREGRVVRIRHDFSFESHIQDLGPDLFRRLYRVTVSQFRILADMVRSSLERTKQRKHCAGSTSSVEVTLCLTLRVLAGASYLDLGWPYGVSTPTTYKLIDETLVALDRVLAPISFQSTELECRNEADKFLTLRRSRIGEIIAALDGIAIQIIQPDLRDTPDPRKYYNRKGFYAICVQAAVGADYKFVFVSARHAGGTHDSTAYQATRLHDLVKENKLPPWVIIAADDAYPNGIHIVTPYGGSNLSNTQDTFNYFLSLCRTIVEQAFGMLVSRFGVFWSPLRFGLSKDTLIIMVSCKLHNFIIDHSDGDEYATVGLADENNVMGSPVVYTQNSLHVEQGIQRSRQRNRENTLRRDHIAARLTTLGFIRPRRRT